MAFSKPGQTRQRIYDFMRRQILAGNSPSVREVKQALGFKATQTVYAHLETLVREGLLAKQPNRSRGYRLPSRNSQIDIPILGQIRAGNWAAALEEPLGVLTVHSRYSPERLFALRVRGDSMIGAGIMPDDVLVVLRTPTADSGRIVVALVEDEATVKRLVIDTIEAMPNAPAADCATSNRPVAERRPVRTGVAAGRPAVRTVRIGLYPENSEYRPLFPDPELLVILGVVIEVHRYYEANGGSGQPVIDYE